eukprot:6415974-Amphidinium_carterae.1
MMGSTTYFSCPQSFGGGVIVRIRITLTSRNVKSLDCQLPSTSAQQKQRAHDLCAIGFSTLSCFYVSMNVAVAWLICQCRHRDILRRV